MDSPAGADLTRVMPSLRELADRIYGNRRPPRVGLVRQRIDAPVVGDIEAEVEREVLSVIDRSGRKPGPIAVGAGSRGIANLDRLVRATVDALKQRGFEPYIVPAMGSHAGATADGQRDLLAGYGITQETMGVPVRATMDTVVIGEVDGIPVHMDRNVAETGAAFLVCRVKPHTDFRGAIESGPSKMCAIGLGKQKGAQTLHSAGVRGLRDVMPKAARVAVDKGILLGATCVVENQRDETALIKGLTGAEVGGRDEEALLEEAYRLLPRIPFDVVDVAVVDRMGKNISGTGMDSNVLNRARVPGEAEPEGLFIMNVAVLDLTEETHGNATGIGLADFMPARVMAKLDLAWTYMNGLTAGVVGTERIKLPIVLPTDRDVIIAAVATCGRTEKEPVRLAWIQDTLHTEILGVSEALLEEARRRDDLEVLAEAEELPLDSEGALQPLAEWAASARALR
jgi:hypothetical protein